MRAEAVKPCLHSGDVAPLRSLAQQLGRLRCSHTPGIHALTCPPACRGASAACQRRKGHSPAGSRHSRCEVSSKSTLPEGCHHTQQPPAYCLIVLLPRHLPCPAKQFFLLLALLCSLSQLPCCSAGLAHLHRHWHAQIAFPIPLCLNLPLCRQTLHSAIQVLDHW